MPEYSFECLKCGRKFSIFATYQDMSLMDKSCPDCKSDILRRIWFAPKVKYVGSGFYSTDNKKDK